MTHKDWRVVKPQHNKKKKDFSKLGICPITSAICIFWGHLKMWTEDDSYHQSLAWVELKYEENVKKGFSKMNTM